MVHLIKVGGMPDTNMVLVPILGTNMALVPILGTNMVLVPILATNMALVPILGTNMAVVLILLRGFKLACSTHVLSISFHKNSNWSIV